MLLKELVKLENIVMVCFIPDQHCHVTAQIKETISYQEKPISICCGGTSEHPANL